MVKQSMTSREVQEEAEELLRAMANRIVDRFCITNNRGEIALFTSADIRQALTTALGERLGQQGRGVVIIWYEAGEVQINIAGTR